MPPVIRSQQVANSGSATATVFTPALPSGVGAPVAGDLLFGIAVGSLGVAPSASPSGWTLVRNIADANLHMSVYRKTAVGGDAAPSWTATARKWAGWTCAITALTWDTGTPVDVENGAAQGTTAATLYTTPSVSVTTDGCLVIAAFGNRAASTWTTTSTSPSMTEAGDTSASGTTPASIGVYHTGGNAVPIGTITRTGTASVSSADACMWIGAVRLAAAAPVDLTRSRRGHRFQQQVVQGQWR